MSIQIHFENPNTDQETEKITNDFICQILLKSLRTHTI